MPHLHRDQALGDVQHAHADCMALVDSPVKTRDRLIALLTEGCSHLKGTGRVKGRASLLRLFIRCDGITQDWLQVTQRPPSLAQRKNTLLQTAGAMNCAIHG